MGPRRMKHIFHKFSIIGSSRQGRDKHMKGSCTNCRPHLHFRPRPRPFVDFLLQPRQHHRDGGGRRRVQLLQHVARRVAVQTCNRKLVDLCTRSHTGSYSKSSEKMKTTKKKKEKVRYEAARNSKINDPVSLHQ